MIETAHAVPQKCWDFGDSPLRHVRLSCVNCGEPSLHTGLHTNVFTCARCYRDGFRPGRNDFPKFYPCVVGTPEKSR